MGNTLVFIHGLESTAQGAKGQFFLNFSRKRLLKIIREILTRA